jgi:hypothetical protein
MSADALWSSTKEGVRSGAASQEVEPAPPSSTLVPLFTAIASLPLPL